MVLLQAIRWTLVAIAAATFVGTVVWLSLEEDRESPGTLWSLHPPRPNKTDLPSPAPPLDLSHPDWNSFIGGPALASVPADFEPLWESDDGSVCGTTLPRSVRDHTELLRVTRDGRVRVLDAFARPVTNSPEVALGQILDALPVTASPAPVTAKLNRTDALLPVPTRTPVVSVLISPHP